MGSTNTAIEEAGQAAPGRRREPLTLVRQDQVKVTHFLPGSTFHAPPFPTAMRLLVAEANERLRSNICAQAATWTFGLPCDHSPARATFTNIVQASSVAETIGRLEDPVDVLIVDMELGSESGLAIVRHASQLDRAPAVLAISDQATAAVGFELAQLGARSCLGKPFEMDDLRAAIQAMLAHPPDLSASAKAQVGYRHIHVVQDEVKAAMLKQAFILEQGNITRAARRLGVTRTAVQQMLDRYGLPRSLGASDRSRTRPSEQAAPSER